MDNNNPNYVTCSNDDTIGDCLVNPNQIELVIDDQYPKSIYIL